MSELNAAVRGIALPPSMQRLPVDRRGYPVPFFVSWETGEADFRVIAPDAMRKAWREQRCWICGGKLGRLKVSVIGPMCTVNRVSSEPPSHLACARYAAQACPFLSNPRMRRNDKDLPEEKFVPGVSIDRNPGVTVLWASLHHSKPEDVSGLPIGNGGILWRLGAAEHVEWWAHGRRATRQECQDAIESGLPSLRAVAEMEGDGAIEDLAKMTLQAVALMPEAAHA